MNCIRKELFKSLVTKYQSEIQSSRTSMLIYFNNSVGIGEHPQHVEEMDKLTEKLASAHDKLEALNKYFPNN